VKSLLVALDHSPRAPRVLAIAADLAARYGASLVLLRVVHIPPEFPPAAHLAQADGLEGHLRSEARGQMEALAVGLDGALSWSVVVEAGEPWSTILECAERHASDLIVMGSHGYVGLDRLLGTTAAKVANHARRNVFIVHS
jgi:nucleotide-binding universal stress UspA family protein